MPSHGFYLRHVKNIEFANVEIQTMKEDLRPAFVLDDVQDADFFRVRVPHPADSPTFALHNVGELRVHQCSGVKDIELQKVDQRTL
jgi:hypothetical protein